MNAEWTSFWIGVASSIFVVLLQFFVAKIFKFFARDKKRPVGADAGQPAKVPAAVNHLVLVEIVSHRDSPQSDGKDSGVGPYIWGLLFALAATAVLMAQYWFFVVPVMLGLAAGQAIVSVVLFFRFRPKTSLPLATWTVTSLLVAGVLVAGAWLLGQASYKGLTIPHVSKEISGKTLGDAVNLVLDRYSADGIGFLMYELIGIALLLLLAVLVIIRLSGVVAAAAVINSPNPRAWQLRVVRGCYPTKPVIDWVVLGVLCVVGLAFASGLAYEKIRESQPFPEPTLTNSPTPSKPRPTKTK